MNTVANPGRAEVVLGSLASTAAWERSLPWAG